MILLLVLFSMFGYGNGLFRVRTLRPFEPDVPCVIAMRRTVARQIHFSGYCYRHTATPILFPITHCCDLRPARARRQLPSPSTVQASANNKGIS